MKKFLDKIKSKWRDNKAEFLLQALSVLLAFTLLCVGFTTTLSAQVEPRVETYTPSIGIYEMKLPSTFHYTNFEFSLNFKLTYYDVYCSKIRVSVNNGVNNVEFYVSSSNVSNIPANNYVAVANDDVFYGLSYFINIETSQTLSFADGVRFEDMFGLSTPNLPDYDPIIYKGQYELKLPTSFQYTNFEIPINFKLTYFDIYCNKVRVRSINGENVVDYYVTTSNASGVPSNSYITVAEGDYIFRLFYIDVLTSQTLSDNDYARFNDIFSLLAPDLPDDPDLPDIPDYDYIISKGSYIAGSGYTFPNQFITGNLNFTSYNRLTNETIRFSALRIGVRNDIAYIEYYNVEDAVWDEVYADGWQLDSFQSITVLDTASVSEEFYNKFNQIFSPASEYDAGFVAGYDEGFWDGKDEGYEEGYRQGYLQGSDDSGGEGFVGNMIRSVFDGLDACEIYANYSILDLLKTIIGIFGAIWLLKLLAGG